jgi:hypothetical protein
MKLSLAWSALGTSRSVAIGLVAVDGQPEPSRVAPGERTYDSGTNAQRVDSPTGDDDRSEERVAPRRKRRAGRMRIRSKSVNKTT